MELSTATATYVAKLPVWLGTLVIVAASVLFSATATYLSMDETHMSPQSIRQTWIMTLTIPVIVSGPVGYVIVSLLRGLDKLRREAEYLANTDVLTGALNRRQFVEVANSKLTAAKESNSTISVLLLDVDDFKKVNDIHGHDAGDAVLKMIAERCSGALRPEDTFARWGGEEFVAVLPCADESESIGIALKIRDAISTGEVDLEETRIRVTASIGVAPQIAAEETLSSMLTRADQAMYQAKRGGKNAAVVDPSPEDVKVENRTVDDPPSQINNLATEELYKKSA